MNTGHILTREEIHALQAMHPTENDPMPFARASEAALLAKLGAMQLAEPVAYSVGNTLKWHAGKGLTNVQLYTDNVCEARNMKLPSKIN